ncbi:MAG: autotransporter domain-containing protein [Sphingopyxis sp.]|uniref:autotransporter domain-containing protein n=1 Tax=Sphingopyxis sp. TaxID=1908224 RepID=UPI002AB994CE|nr:autotransporter domain-containing protein [Sphingopyxis sp.]MDZ3832319.1 autotransporter domain-containing protein [Sphingopyxis sp.]
MKNASALASRLPVPATLSRALLLSSVACLSIGLAATAQAQSTDSVIYLREGQTRQGNVETPAGQNRVVLDIEGGRLDHATGNVNLGALENSPALLTGDLIIAPDVDRLWFRAQGEQSASLFEGTAVLPNGQAFDGVGYEASGNDSVLTLTRPTAGGNREMEQTVYLGGDGRINIDATINTTAHTGRAAIVVQPVSTSGMLGEGGDGKIDLVIRSSVTGIREAYGSLVDAQAAGTVTVVAGATVGSRGGVALSAGTAQVTLDAGAKVQLLETSFAVPDNSAALATSGLVSNLGSITGINTRVDAPVLGNGIDATNATILNRRNGGQLGKIEASGNAIFTRGDTLIVNDGEIVSLLGAGVQVQGITSTTVLRNGARGLVQAGTLQGIAYQGVRGTDVIVNEGTIRGDVRLGDGADIYLVKGNAAVTGEVDGGDGQHDAYGRSYSESATVTLANGSLNIDGRIGFEMHGIEAAGTDTVVTVNAEGPLEEGLHIIGNGTVVNNAAINSGQYANGIYIRDIANIAGNGRFINRGVISSATRILRSESAGGEIRNEGQMSGQLGALIEVAEGASGEALDFVNTGVIDATATATHGVHMLINKTGHVARISNGAGGRILQSASGAADDAAFALNVRSRGRVELANAGTLLARSRTDGGARIEATSIDINNSGTIEGSGAGGSGLTVIANGGSGSGDPQVVASVRNSGTMRANGGTVLIANAPALGHGFGAYVRGDNAVVALDNAGEIEATGANSVAVLVHADNSDGPGRAHFRMTNDGTVRGASTDTIYGPNVVPRPTAMPIPDALGDYDAARVVASAIQTFGTTDTIVNSGAIVGNVGLADGDDRFENRGSVEGDVRLGEGKDVFVFVPSGTLTGIADGGSDRDTILVDGSSNLNGRITAAQYRSFERIEGLAGVPQGTGVLSVAGAFDTSEIELANIAIQVDVGDIVSSEGAFTFLGYDGRERIANNGTIGGGIDLGGGDDVVVNAGIIDGDVLLGGGNDRYAGRAGSVINGLLDGGDGIDTFEFLLSGDIGNLPSGLTGFESYAARGQGTIHVVLDQDIDTIELLDGASLVLDGGSGAIQNIVGDTSNNVVTVAGTLTGGVNLGGGDDILNLTLAGVLSGALDGGLGSDTLNLTLTDAATINGMNGFETANIAGAAPLTLGGLGVGQTVNFDGSDNELIVAAGAAFAGVVNGGAGRDLLRIQSGAQDSRTIIASQIAGFEDLRSEGPGTLALTGGAYGFQSVFVDGALELGANTSLVSASGLSFGDGDNRLRLGSGAVVTGGIDGGDGSDLLQLEQAQGSVRSLRSLGAIGFERLESSGAGELQIDIDTAFDMVHLDGGRLTVAAGTSLTAPVAGGTGNDRLAVLGTLVGDVDLGSGDDRLVLGHYSAANRYAGGAGTDTVELHVGSTYDDPFELPDGAFLGFERLDVGSGVVSITQDMGWDSLTVSGGRLIGQAGTTITSASAILVASGAVFGSAGTVNADIDVRGTLSPGVSPGTMTVNGDVVFRTGSNLLLEVTPTVSDLLNVSGVMTIETGAAVDITGVLQGTPGQLLDLVVASGGIQGRFTTINKSDSVFGFVVQNGNRLQIRSEFENDGAYPANVRASIDYSNQVLRSGYGVQAYTGALGVLTDAQGRANRTAFAQLAPEAYASAMHVGTDAALTLSNNIRQMNALSPWRDGLFLFGQAAFGDGKLGGSARTGASSGRSDTDGVFGGVGYGFGEKGQAGIFIGSLDTKQRLAALGAETKADGFAVGAYVDSQIGALGLHAMIARVGSDAVTSRSLLVAASPAVGRYDLDSWVADLTIDYAQTLGAIRIAPRIGLVYADTKGGAVDERGAGAFALAVEKRQMRGLFGDMALRLSAAIPADGVTITPFVEAGYRVTLDGMSSTATGAFSGATGEGFQADGARNDRSTTNLAAGVAVDVTPAVRVNFGYSRDLAKAERGSFSGGVSIRF